MMSNATIMIMIIIMINFVESLESSVAAIRNDINYIAHLVSSHIDISVANIHCY